MSVPAVIQAVSSVITAAAALAAFINSLRNTKKIHEVHIATNSLTDRLVIAAGREGRAQGHAEGLEVGRKEPK